MKKNIRVAANRIFCLVMICALVLSSYPIRTAAADGEETPTAVAESSTEESVPGTEEQVPEESQEVVASSASTEEDATDRTEESTETTQTETTTEVVTEEVATEVQTEEVTTESVTEEVTTEEVTTEEETTEPITEGFSFFGLARNGSDDSEILSQVSVSVKGIEVDVKEPVYKSDKEGKNIHYEVAVEAKVIADLEIGKDDLDKDEEEAIEEHVEGAYRAELQIQTSSEAYEMLDCDTFEVSKDFQIEDVDLKGTVDITESKTYQWRVVVYKDDTEQSTKLVSESYEVPEKIGVVVTPQPVELAEVKEETNDRQEVIKYIFPYTAKLNISLTGIDNNVAIEKRKKEIKYALSQCQYAVMMDFEDKDREIKNTVQVLTENLFDGSDKDTNSIVDGLMESNGKSVTYEKTGNQEVTSKGEYSFYIKSGDNVTAKVSKTIDIRPQDIEYAPNPAKDIYEYDESITFSQTKGVAVGEITCYESDKDGVEKDSGNLKIEGNAKDGFVVTGQKLSGDETFYVTMKHSGNGTIYDEEFKVYEIKTKKVAVTGSVTVREKESGFLFWKTKTMYVDVRMKSDINCDLLKNDHKNIDFKLEYFSTGAASGKTLAANRRGSKYENGEAIFTYEVTKDQIKKLDSYSEYSIRATADYQKIENAKGFVYYESLMEAYGPFEIRPTEIDINISKINLNENNELVVEYNNINKEGNTETGNQLKYTVLGDAEDNSAIAYTITSDNAAVVEILDEEGHYRTNSAGTATITITADDPSDAKYDVYEKKTVTFTVKVVSPSNISYSVKKPDTVIHTGDKEEKWYKEAVTLTLGEGNLYDEIEYSTDGQKTWTRVPVSEFVIKESMPTDYTFFFCDTETKIRSCDIVGREGTYETLNGIAVDLTNPSWNTAIVSDIEPSVHSTNEISYFSKEIVLTAYAGNTQGSGQKVDAGAGIKELYVKYGDGEWELVKKVDLADRYNDRYSITLSEDKTYGKVFLKVVDYLGHESENVAVYNRVVCIDKVNPVVIAVPIDDERNETGYNGEWTNNQLQYRVSLEDGVTQVSGIHSFEYTYIPRGSKTTLDTAIWNKISGIGEGEEQFFKVVLGRKWEDIQQTLEGTLIYEEDGTAQVQLLADEETAVQMNGTLYVRAESNAGLVTTQDDSIHNKDEVRIWQEKPEVAKVFADNKSDATTGWYNKETGDVRISFEYPAYDAANYAPAVGLVYTFGTKDAEEKEFTEITKRFYKGIFDEETGEVTEVSDYENPTEEVNLKEQGYIDINTDSINMITVYVEDAAGNKSDITTYEIKADFIEPQNMTASYNGGSQKVYLDSSESSAYTLFTKSGVKVDAGAEYGISKKQNFYMGLTKEQGGRAELSSGNSKDSLSIEPCTRGFVYLCAVDGAGNKSEAWTNGIVVDDQKPTGGSKQDISIVTKGKNSAGFFNKDVAVSLNVEDAPANDDYSGLKSVTYTLGRDNQNTESDITVFESQPSALSWEAITKNHSFATDNIVINAANNESNNAFIKVTATDYAGNISTITQELQIDVTKPQIDITFDNNNALNETYYNSNRVARIDIKELNFDPSQVNFVIYKDGAEDKTLTPAVSSWTESEGNIHSTYITFAQDGDYSFEVWCTDLAGNESEKQVTDVFTIDQTKPVVTVTYDNNDAWKANYYSQARTATVTVTEHNFNERDFVATITPNAALGGWSHNGDVHTTTIRFDQEVHYSYTVNYTDLAGNVMDAFTQEEFYIDMNSPVIHISGVEDKSANAGEVIPVVTVTDNNYDFEGVQLILENSKGQHIAVLHESAIRNGGYSYTLTNVNEQPDEIYTLTAIATDMAGNESTLSYRFSLNRNGSVYDLSQISALVETAYVRHMDMQDLQIFEMNVNTVEEFNLFVTRNGQAVNGVKVNSRPETMDEDAVYFSTRVEGNDEVGYEYEYTIYRESFAQEGIYNIMFYSRDKAGNEVNNTLTEKEAELTFVVDNSAPTVVIDGVEAGELYTEETKDVNVYVSDNFKLQEATFKLVDEDGNVLETYNYMELAAAEGDVVALTLPSSDKKLHIEYYALDVAGNDITTMQDEEVATSFMITTNAWIRYINNKVAVAGTVAAGAGVAAAAGTGVFFRRRKKLKIAKTK